MLQAMFSGVSGLQAHQTKMNVIGNNISNVNTIGFKAGRVSFQDQLSQTLRSDSGASANQGGQNPAQVGLGVGLGAVDTIQSQGNLQLSGKQTDLAIQGNGFFPVANGSRIFYTRDGSFDLDSTGALVSPSNGSRLLGYPADANGVVDTGAPISAASTLQIPIGKLTSVKQTSSMSFAGNLDAGAALVTTKVDFSGNLDSAAAPGTTLPAPLTTTVYDAYGNAHSVQTTFSNPVDNPTGPSVPAGATRAWNVQVKVDGVTAYDSNAGKSRLYRVGGAWQFADAAGSPLGANISLDGGAALNHGTQVPGLTGAPAFSVDLKYGTVTANAASSTLAATANGNTGSFPVWTNSIRVFDSLGVGHLLTFKYSRVPLQPSDPNTATIRWDWAASEGGASVASSLSAGNGPLYFDANGKIVGGQNQNLTVTPTDGSVSPFTVKVNNSRIGQLAAESTVAADSQDGFPVGTLQSFNVSSDGTITGVFSNGQTRPLGQVALTSFTNPAGLDKVGNNLFKESTNTGFAQVGVPGLSGRGKVSPGYLEMSNVDLSTEFTNLIVTQRGFQANTRIVSVVDQLLQDVINLKR